MVIQATLGFAAQKPLTAATPETYFQIGLIYLENNSYDRAIANFEKALEMNPAYSSARLKLAETVKAKETTELEALLAIADVYEQRGMYEEAAQSYRKALERDPANWDYYQSVMNNLGKRPVKSYLAQLEYLDYRGLVEGFQILATALGITLAGLWTYMLFVNRRQRYPRAKVNHQIITKSIGTNNLLLRLTLTIQNVGEVILRVDTAEARLLQVIPLKPNLQVAVNSGTDPVPQGETEVDWPLIGEPKTKTWPSRAFAIEPTENDQIHFDFFVDKNIEAVATYTYVRNTRAKRRFYNFWRPREIGWGLTTIHDLTSRKRLRRMAMTRALEVRGGDMSFTASINEPTSLEVPSPALGPEPKQQPPKPRPVG